MALYCVVAMRGVVAWIVANQTINSNASGTSFKQVRFFKEIGFNLLDARIYAKPPRGAVRNNKTYWQAFEYMFVLIFWIG